MYVIGYLFFSILVQIYSLFICVPEIKKTKSKHKRQKNKKSKNKKL
jgi:hypothetical protein